jgi:hypothetical protein
MSYDQWKTDSGYAEKTPEEENEGRDCPICDGDCAGANPPVYNCPLKEHTMSTSGEKTHTLSADAKILRVIDVRTDVAGRGQTHFQDGGEQTISTIAGGT